METEEELTSSLAALQRRSSEELATFIVSLTLCLHTYIAKSMTCEVPGSVRVSRGEHPLRLLISWS